VQRIEQADKREGFERSAIFERQPLHLAKAVPGADLARRFGDVEDVGHSRGTQSLSVLGRGKSSYRQDSRDAEHARIVSHVAAVSNGLHGGFD
jgi:hypothetical protein